MSEVYRQIDYHRIYVAKKITGANLGSLNLFCNCEPSAYSVQLKVNPRFGELVHHTVAVHVTKHCTKLTIPSETVAIITDNYTVIGNVQKRDVEEAVAQESSMRIFQKFLGPIRFKIACIHCIYSRIHLNSTCQQSQEVARKK